MKDIKGRIIERKDLCSDVIELVIKAEEPVKYQAGQYLMIKVPVGEKFQYRAYSVANHPDEKEGKTVRVVAKILTGGLGSAYLSTKKENDDIEFRGGLGFFTFKSPSIENIYFICTGTGLIPLLAMIEDQLANGNQSNFNLLWGNRFVGDIFWQELLDDLMVKYSNFNYDLILSKPDEKWPGKKGYVTELVTKDHLDFANGHYYVCGHPAMIDDVKKILIEKGITKERLFEEKYISVGKAINK